ncbi:MAG: hypothetical protein PHY97_05465 [Bacteroidales bacterium]|nr:hypothetical protein [Bacteroidales bacterium]MDD4044865.1 hypothetical protein [Bacteroidales bacterium]
MILLSLVSLVSFDGISKGVNPNHPLTRLVSRLKKGGKIEKKEEKKEKKGGRKKENRVKKEGFIPVFSAEKGVFYPFLCDKTTVFLRKNAEYVTKKMNSYPPEDGTLCIEA